MRQVPDAATTSQLNQRMCCGTRCPSANDSASNFDRFFSRSATRRSWSDGATLRAMARASASVSVTLDEEVGDRREQTGVEVPRLLRRDEERQPILAALLGHRFQQLQSAGFVIFGEDYRVSQPLLSYAPACPYVSARRPVQTLPKKPAIANSRSGPLAPAAPTAAKPRTKRDHGRATPGTCPPQSAIGWQDRARRRRRRS